jgi:hypothetical protein
MRKVPNVTIQLVPTYNKDDASFSLYMYNFDIDDMKLSSNYSMSRGYPKWPLTQIWLLKFLGVKPMQIWLSVNIVTLV